MPKFADVQALNALGLKTTGALIRACRTPEGRSRIVRETGLSEDLLESLAEMTDWKQNGPLIDLLDQTLRPAGYRTVKDDGDFED